MQTATKTRDGLFYISFTACDKNILMTMTVMSNSLRILKKEHCTPDLLAPLFPSAKSKAHQVATSIKLASDACTRMKHT